MNCKILPKIRKQVIVILPILICIPFSFANAYFLDRDTEYVTDAELREVAIENLIIPHSPDKEYIEKQWEESNSLATWLMMSRQQKVTIINGLKEMYLEKRGVTIKLPSSYYVDEINANIYNGILNNSVKVFEEKGIVIIFRTIAVMDGDYDEGGSILETAARMLTEPIFEAYKLLFPEKYEYLVEFDKEEQ